MKENNRLFPIGVLAKLSGVHIRSLRYYETLGILKPEYIDPETLYRYYTYRQMRVVEAIQYCVELDIPLKKFAEFLSQESGQIDYAALAQYGKKVTEEKMQSILNRQRFLEEMTEGMAHAAKCAQNGKTTTWFPERYFYFAPYTGPQNGGTFQSAMVKLINDLESNGFQASYSNGVMLRFQGGKPESFCFVEIKKTGKDISAYPQIFTIPAGAYLCVTAGESSIERAADIFSGQLSEDCVVYETELFLEKFDYNNPVYELRCFTGESKK